MNTGPEAIRSALDGYEPEPEALDLGFRHFFASWFYRVFLVLRAISWDDLRRRLQSTDHRCFAFFHPATR